MRSILKIFLSIIFSISVIKAQTESLPLIEDLERGDYLAILTINADRLVEYVPYLDTSIFKQKHIHIVREYLETLGKLNSSNIIPTAKAFIDSLDSPYFLKDEKEKIDITESRLFATEILFEHGDYSTGQYIFDYINDNRDNLKHYVYFIEEALELILYNVPSFSEQAKTELIYMAQNNSKQVMRLFAMFNLNKAFGSEMNGLIVDRLVNDEDAGIKMSALHHLFKNNYPDLDQLIIERLYADTSPFTRIDLAKILLDSIGTPFHYTAVKNYLEVEQNQIARGNIEVALELFWPKPPYNLNTVMEYLEYTYSLCDTLPLYTWLGDLSFSNQLKAILATAKTNLQSGDSLSCAVKIKSLQDLVDNVYKDSLNADPRFVTFEGWKFLYSNAYYILDRLPEPPIIIAAEIDVINPAMSLVNPGAFTMEVKGSGFSSSSVVNFNGNARATTFVSDSVLNTQILSTDVSVAGNFPVWVSDNSLNSDTLIYKVVSALPQPVRPVLECVTNNGDGTYTAFFGYKNENSVSVYIPVGSKNKFTPNPQDRGQTRVFKPGRQIKVYTVNFNGSNLVWTLNGRTSTASKNSAACQ